MADHLYVLTDAAYTAFATAEANLHDFWMKHGSRECWFLAEQLRTYDHVMLICDARQTAQAVLKEVGLDDR